MRKVYVIQLDNVIMDIYTSKKVALREFILNRKDIKTGRFYWDLNKDKVECEIIQEKTKLPDHFIARTVFVVTATNKYHTMTLREYELNESFHG